MQCRGQLWNAISVLALVAVATACRTPPAPAATNAASISAREQVTARLPEVHLVIAETDDAQTLEEVMHRAARVGDFVVTWDASTDATRAASVEFVGRMLVPKSRVLEWMQAVAAYYDAALVPTGPDAETGRPTHYCMSTRRR